MADDPTQPSSSEDLVRAARESVGSSESLSEQMLREAHARIEPAATSQIPMAEPTDAPTEPAAVAPPPEVEAPSRSRKSRLPPPRATQRRPGRTSTPRPPVPSSPPSDPLAADTRRRLPRAARGLIPLIIFGVIFLTNILGDNQSQPDSVTVDVTVETQSPPSGVEVSNDAPSVNLALGSPVNASGQTANGAAALAIDGDPSTAWNSGGFPSQWIDIDLGAPGTIREVRLRVGQSPPVGDTSHRVLARGPGTDGEYHLFHAFEGQTRDGTWITAKPEEPWPGIDHIRISTVESPSWVAWFEVEILGVQE